MNEQEVIVIVEPYYMEKKEYSPSNKTKANLGELGFSNALSDFPILCNITYGHRQKDIDHLVLTYDHLVFNESKNVKEGFRMHFSWFLSHVVDRFSDGLPLAQYYGRACGYSANSVVFTLTIPCLNTDPLVIKSLKGLEINVIQTNRQLLHESDLKKCCSPIRRQFLSVINTRQVKSNNRPPKATEIRKSQEKKESQVREEVQFEVIENPLRSSNIETCLFCKRFFVCLNILKFRKAYKKEEKEFWENDPLPVSLEQRFKHQAIMTGELSKAWNKIYKCLRKQLHLYYKKGWKAIFLRDLYRYEFYKRRRYLMGVDIDIHHPERREREWKSQRVPRITDLFYLC